MSAVTQLFSGTRGAGETWSNPAAALERRTVLVERAVAEAYEQHLAPCAPEGLALLAVGGFGRRELFPHSDVDLLLLAEKPAIAERQRAAILGFLQALWDGGLRVSHSVRTPAECRELDEQNIELSISLLDERLLAGDRGLYAKLVPGLARFFHGQRQALARHLCRRARERHHKYGGSIYQLEPDVKEGPGGLRDFQLLAWLERLRQAQPDRLPLREGFAGLLPASNFLYAVRIFLHDRTGRDSNTLTFDLQDEAAEQFSREPADWMRDYYASAREIHRACARAIDAAEERASSLLVGFREWRSRVSNAEFYVARERVYFRAPQGLEQDPALSLRLFEFAGRHGMRLALETERRLAQALPLLRRHFAAPPAPLWPALRELLAMPHCALALRAMQETGVLGALFPEWEPIECLVIRDFHHRYTVDEHTLRAIETLDELGTAREPSLERFSELLAEIDDPELLRFALLFHDLGKAAPLGRHVPESLRLAQGALERIGMPEEQRRTVAALVERHLDLSRAMS
ncbi:MAG: HD domain-containing protein, partial [Bryobacteraceae bacterium]